MEQNRSDHGMHAQISGIIPAVNGKISPLEGRFVLPKAYCIRGGFEAPGRIFAARMEGLGPYRYTEAGKPVITFVPDGTFSPEAYELRILTEGIAIRAGGETGFRWALTTLCQLLVKGNGSVPCCVIKDRPRWHYRGMMLDVCRHFFTAEEIKKILEQLSLLKMNVFHWHLSDDQGFRIESRRFPLLNRVGSWRKLSPQDPMVEEGRAGALDSYGGFYTQEEIRDIVAFAADRGIEVIPEIDVPGHSSAILAAYPQYSCTGEPLRVKNTFGVHPRIFCAGREETYAFLEALLDEVTELFPGPRFHLGGDEAPKDAWHACPRCKSMMERYGLQNYEQLQAWFTGRLIDHLKALGKAPIVWNESAASGMLDSAALVQYWAEMAPGKSYMLPELARGRRIIFSNDAALYCSSGYAEMPMKSTLLFAPNVKGVPVPDSQVAGIEAPVWTEWICSSERLETMLYPRLLAVAELGWTKDKDADGFFRRAEDFLSQQGLNILTPMPWEEAAISGQKAVAQLVQALLTMGARYAGMTTGEEDEAPAKVEAVTPDGTGDMDREAMTRAYVTEKMKGAYSQEEIEEAIRLIQKAMLA